MLWIQWQVARSSPDGFRACSCIFAVFRTISKISKLWLKWRTAVSFQRDLSVCKGYAVSKRLVLTTSLGMNFFIFVFGFLVFGFWFLVFRFSIIDFRISIFDFRFFDFRFSIFDFRIRFSFFDFRIRFSFFDFRFSIFDFRFSIFEFHFPAATF